MFTQEIDNLGKELRK